MTGGEPTKMKSIRSWVYGLLLFGFLAWVAYSSPDLQECFAAHYKNYAGDSAQQNVTAFSVLLGTSRECVGEFIHDNGEAVIALFTVILALATILLWLATQNLLRGAEETSKIQLRAYVFPVAASLNEGKFMRPRVINRKNCPYIYLEWKNTGQTPAKKVVTWSQVEVIEPINEDKLIVPPLEQKHFNTLGSTVGGNKGSWFRELTKSEMADITAGIKFVYLYGRIEYTDVFNERRWTNFRLYYSGYFPLKAANATFSICVNGNDST